MSKYIKPIKIGKKILKNNLFLAPMEGFTNVGLRKALSKYAYFNGFTEMIPANALSKDGNYCKDLLYRDDSEQFLTYQLFGNKLGSFSKSIHNCDERADMFNLNVGCPVSKIINQGAGCALMKQKNKVYKIIKEMKSATDKAISIKIRTGYSNNSHLDYDQLYSAGCDIIFIHARTCKQKYAGNINIDFLKEAKEKSSIPIIANGDIKTIEDIKEIHNKTNINGFMIGRALIHNPAVFRDIINENYNKKWASTIGIEEKLLFLGNYYKNLLDYEIKGAFVKVKTLALFMLRYSKNAKKLREQIIITKDFNSLKSLIENYINKYC